MKNYTESQMEAVITWYLKKNPESITLMLSDAKQFLLNALETEKQFLSEIVVNENKMSAFVEYIAPKLFTSINNITNF